MTTKGDIVNGALAEIGIAINIFGVDPDEQDRALARLDNMMAAVDGIDVKIGYNLPATPEDSNLSDDAGIPDTCVAWAKVALAIAIAPSYGKNVSPYTLNAATTGYNQMLTQFAWIPQQSYGSRTPRGSGNIRDKFIRNYFRDKPPCDE